MNTQLVSYDLNAPEKNYPKLTEKLYAYGRYWHELDSFWLVKTNETPMQLCDQLLQLIDNDDELLVVNVTGDLWTATEGFGQEALQWLHNQM